MKHPCTICAPSRRPLLLALILLVFAPGPAGAGVGTKLDDWFGNQNYVNATRPGVYETQSARYATFGGLSYRAPITQPFRLLSLQTPRFSAGCGGIDLYAGGFSVMNADQFVDALRAIGQNAASLAFMLAIQIVSPQLSGVMEDIQSWANEYLTLGNNSCEAATKLVGGALELFGKKEANCTIKRMQQAGEDWNTANYFCTTGGRIKSTEAATGGPNQIEFTKGNLTWFVLMQNPFFRADLEFAELMMNITGTIIYRDAGPDDYDPTAISHVTAALNEQGPTERFNNIYAALMHGADAAQDLLIYRCTPATRTTSPEGCQHFLADLQPIVPTWAGMHQRIEALVENIVAKIQGDTALTTQEVGLIGASSLPLYRFLTAASAYHPNDTASGTTVIELSHEYTALFARNIILRSIGNVLEQVEFQLENLPNRISWSDQMRDFGEQLREVIKGVAALERDTEIKARQYQQLVEQIRDYEREIMTRLGKGFMQAARWGR